MDTWVSYEERIRRHAADLAEEAPFLFGHDVSYTVRETYGSALVVEAEGQSHFILCHGPAVLGSPTRSQIQKWSVAVLEGRDPRGVLRKILAFPEIQSVLAEADHVVRDAAYAALRTPDTRAFQERLDLLQPFLAEGSQQAAPRFRYLHRPSRLTDTALAECKAFVRPAADALLHQARSVYKQRSPVVEAHLPDWVRSQALSQPYTLANIVRTGRRFVAEVTDIQDLAAYADELRAALHVHRRSSQ